ncbi:hypothetical protein MRB53_000745 [Persea americana]|uniref:Uncharacterized protein n=1 Tax=Persea americana TaxID=3435 RepID=A0ACC2MPQ9_PERAE|nr:hypothetical protein MRB53_000745 [Persea americana]
MQPDSLGLVVGEKNNIQIRILRFKDEDRKPKQQQRLSSHWHLDVSFFYPLKSSSLTNENRIHLDEKSTSDMESFEILKLKKPAKSRLDVTFFNLLKSRFEIIEAMLETKAGYLFELRLENIEICKWKLEGEERKKE